MTNGEEAADAALVGGADHAEPEPTSQRQQPQPQQRQQRQQRQQVDTGHDREEEASLPSLGLHVVDPFQQQQQQQQQQQDHLRQSMRERRLSLNNTTGNTNPNNTSTSTSTSNSTSNSNSNDDSALPPSLPVAEEIVLEDADVHAIPYSTVNATDVVVHVDSDNEDEEAASHTSTITSFSSMDENGSVRSGSKAWRRRRRRRRMVTLLVVVSVIVVASVAAAGAIVKSRSAGNSSGVGDADADISSANAIGDITGNNNGDSSTTVSTPTEVDTEMMAGAEAEQLMALRSVLEGWLPHLYGDDASSSPLHDRTTAQYRALYWMANVDEVAPSRLLAVDEPAAADTIITGADRDAIQERIVQRYSLVVLYYATSGEGWRNQYDFLNTTLDECEWGIRDEESADDDGHNGATQTYVEGEGVAQCTDEGFVTALSLSKNRLKTQVPGGGIPEELFELTRLEFLVLGGNNFAGALSPRISQLTRLYYLNIQSTRLEGEIPDLSTLEQINVFFGCCNDFVNLPTFPVHPRSNFLRSVDLANNRIAVNVEDHAEYATFQFIHTLEIEGNPMVGSFDFLCDANPTIYISIDEDQDVDCYCCTYI